MGPRGPERACARRDKRHAYKCFQQGFELAALDLVTVPAWTWHQFRAAADAPLGFLCMVDAERDRPQLPTAEERAALAAIPEVAGFFALD